MEGCKTISILIKIGFLFVNVTKTLTGCLVDQDVGKWETLNCL